jgi:hypothetical protein
MTKLCLLCRREMEEMYKVIQPHTIQPYVISWVCSQCWIKAQALYRKHKRGEIIDGGR